MYRAIRHYHPSPFEPLTLVLPRGIKGSMILITKTYDETQQRGHICVFVFINLLVIVQHSDSAVRISPGLAVFSPPGEGSMIVVTETSDETRQRRYTLFTSCVCAFIQIDIAVHSGPVGPIDRGYSYVVLQWEIKDGFCFENPSKDATTARGVCVCVCPSPSTRHVTF